MEKRFSGSAPPEFFKRLRRKHNRKQNTIARVKALLKDGIPATKKHTVKMFNQEISKVMSVQKMTWRESLCCREKQRMETSLASSKRSLEERKGCRFMVHDLSQLLALL